MKVGVACALAGAALFGLSAPLAKLLLAQVGPQLLAGLLYLGAGIGLSLFRLLRPRTQEAPLRRADAPLLAGVIGFGGVAGPLLLMVGLTRVSGLASALLLNLEAPFTIFLALLFGEHLGKRTALDAAVIVGASVLLSLSPGQLRAEHWGVAAVAGACLCWGLDNNLTQRLSLRDPIAVVQWKTLAAGSFAVGLALATGAQLPSLRVLGAALALGLGAYGVSIVLDVWALRLLGAAREAPLFATAPFVGALAAIPLLGERPQALDLVAAVMMAGGVALLLRERHGHFHTHEPIEHEHLHTHDDGHHAHSHAPDDAHAPGDNHDHTHANQAPTQPHSHPHKHEPLAHQHAHTPDLHHRHKH